MTDFFREINEDIRRDRVLAALQRHGALLLALLVLIMAVAAGFAYWQNDKKTKSQDASLAFSQARALALSGATAKAIGVFDELSAKSGTNYAKLARIQAAQLRAQGGADIASAEQAKGLAQLRRIADDGAFDEDYRHLSLVQWGLLAVDTEKPATIIEAMKPLATGVTPWHYTALEVTALAQLKSGDKASALTTYRSLADDLLAPRGLRARAAEIVAGTKN